MELRIALISSDGDWNRELKLHLSREANEATAGNLKVKVFEKLPTLEEAVIHYAPHLIVIHFEPESVGEKLAFLDQLSRVAERIPVVVSSPDLAAEFMLSCVKKGVRDFLQHPVRPAEVGAMMKRLLHERPKNSEEKQLGETYTYFSYKGGIGTTFLSCNTAVALAQLTKGKVLVWDMVFQNGDVPFFFDHDPVATLTDLLDNLNKIDGQYLAGVLPEHSTGVTILPGPKRPEEAEKIRNDQIQQLLQVLRKHYDYIVIDGGHVLTDPVISVMDQSKYILLTTDLHLPVLKNTLRCLEVFERLGYVDGKFRILLNRYNSKYEKFDLQKAEEILRYSIAFNFSNDYVTASRSLNSGIPVAELDSDSILARQFLDLSDLLTHDFNVTEKKQSFMEKMFSRGGRKKKPQRDEAQPQEMLKEGGDESVPQ